jgi:integrase
MEEVNKAVIASHSKSTAKYYDRVKQSYLAFRGSAPNSEELVLSWLTNEAENKAPTTLWSEISLLLKYLQFEENTKISRDAINLYIKTLSAKHKKKQAPAFSKDDLMKFLASTPNEPQHLTTKLYVLLCYYAALRGSEAADLKFSDIEIIEEGLALKICRKKTDKAKLGEVILAL